MSVVVEMFLEELTFTLDAYSDTFQEYNWNQKESKYETRTV